MDGKSAHGNRVTFYRQGKAVDSWGATQNRRVRSADHGDRSAQRTLQGIA
jgi:hypothetical protein